MIHDRPPVFASDAATASYYERRAAEYDEWYLGEGRFAAGERPGWSESLDDVRDLLRALPRMRTLDVACGTGYLGRYLEGAVVGIDRSPSMARIARDRLVDGTVTVGDALGLPFATGSFERVLAGHFYGHLPLHERRVFLSEVRRVAGELVVVDSGCRPGMAAEQWQERVLNDGSRHEVYKRYLTVAELASEIHGEPMLDGPWFVAARARWSGSGSPAQVVRLR